MTPSQRRVEVVKRKLDNEFAASSSDSAEEGSGREKKEKRKINHAKEAAQLSHQKMCAKAMDAMKFVNNMLTKWISTLTRLGNKTLKENINWLSSCTS